MLNYSVDEVWDLWLSGYFQKKYPSLSKKYTSLTNFTDDFAEWFRKEVPYEKRQSIMEDYLANGLSGIPHKKTIVAAAAKAAKVSQKDAKKIIDAYWNEIVKQLKDNTEESITIPKIGKFSVSTIKKRTYKARDFKTKKVKVVSKAGRDKVKFTESDYLKKFMASKKKSTNATTTKTTTKNTGKGGKKKDLNKMTRAELMALLEKGGN